MMAIVASALVVEAPVRAADLGGWSDTWFAGRGRVCNVAVSPGVVVRITPSGARHTTLQLSTLGLGQCRFTGTFPHPQPAQVLAVLAAATASRLESDGNGGYQLQGPGCGTPVTPAPRRD